MNLQKVTFVKSAASSGDFIRDALPKIVFSGKSNVGKSSVLNCVLGRKNFARVGQKPGKTVHINYFNVDDRAYFVDLPGYGYAQVAASEKERWGKLMETFFAQPELITLGVMIVDARHAPTKLDQVMASLFCSMPFVVVANKTDKLKPSQIAPNMECIRRELALSEEMPLIPFSAEKGTGRDALIALIEQYSK